MSGLIQLTELPLQLKEPILNLIQFSPEIGIITFSGILGALTSIIENIPLIFLTRPIIDLMSRYTDPRIVWWSILAVVNITDSVILISSVKGIYILEMSNREGISITFMDYIRYGLTITGIHLGAMAIYVFILALF
jgi:Na+/H+ antiporter NhaD/arsenite permease-like protein